MLPCYYNVVRVNTVGKVASVQHASFQEDEWGRVSLLREGGGLSVTMNETFSWGSKLLKVAHSTPHRCIALDAKKGWNLGLWIGTPGTIGQRSRNGVNGGERNRSGQAPKNTARQTEYDVKRKNEA